MESFFSRYKNALVLIVVLVAQLLALAVQVKRPSPKSPDQEGVTLIRYVVVSVVTPPERWLHNIGRGIRGVWSGYLDLVHVRQQDAQLKAQIERLELEQASLAEDARQGQRLEQLLSFREHYIYKTLPAQVIGASGTDQSRTLYIDKGAKDGLAPDMPVVTGDGIVGKLKDVFDHKSLVVLISDPTSGVGVMLETTRARGILKGVPFGQLQVINVSPDDRIKPGQRIVTSGGDQIFPRGLPVGTVEGVTPDPDRDPLVDVGVRPAANLSELEEVLVITNMGDIPSAQAEKDLAESEAEGEEEQKRASDVLAERLPGRLDAKAPADTNPDPGSEAGGAGSTGEDVRLMTPPKPLRADQYSPDATPPAAEMTPGQRRAAVLQGSEDIAAPPKKPSAQVAAEGGTVAPANGSGAGALKKTAPSSTAASAATGGALRTAPGEGGAGTVATLPRPVKPAGESVSQSGSTVPRSSAAKPASASDSASGAGRGVPKTRVIDDGPMPNRASESGRTTAPVNVPVKPASVPVKKEPVIVPDDGSRPPPTMRPKPKPAGENSQPASPPNGGG